MVSRIAILVLLVAVTCSCSKINLSKAPNASTTPSSDQASSGPVQAIVELSGEILGPEVTCNGDECEAEIDWE